MRREKLQKPPADPGMPTSTKSSTSRGPILLKHRPMAVTPLVLALGACSSSDKKKDDEPTNTPPVLHNPGTLALVEDSDAQSLGIQAPTDADGDDLTITLTRLPGSGTLTTSDAQGNNPGSVTPTLNMTLTSAQLMALSYTPEADFNGDDNFEYRVSDGTATRTQLIRIQVTPENDPPVLHDPGTLELAEDSNAQSLGIQAPTDADGDDLTITLTQLPGSGTLTTSDAQGSNPGSVTVTANMTLTLAQLMALHYTPDADFSGDDSLEYRVSDGTTTLTQRIDIRVTPVNDPPVLHDPGTLVLVVDSEARPLGIRAPTDADGDSLTITLTQLPGSGTLTTSDAQGNNPGSVTVTANMILTPAQLMALSYTPEADFGGDDGFEYQVSDGTATLTQRIDIRVTPTNELPELFDEPLEVQESTDNLVPSAVLLTTRSELLGSTSFSLGDRYDSHLFRLDASGALRFLAPPDFENPLDGDGDNQYRVEISFTDIDGVERTGIVIVQLQNDPDDDPSPAATDGLALSRQFLFDGDSGAQVGELSVVDNSLSGSITYSLTGTDAALFEVDASGVLKLRDGQSANFRDDTSYQISVTASDGTNSIAQDFTIQVAPTATANTSGLELRSYTYLGNDTPPWQPLVQSFQIHFSPNQPRVVTWSFVAARPPEEYSDGMENQEWVDTAADTDFRAAVRQAFEIYSRHLPIRFEEIGENGGRHGDIRIGVFSQREAEPALLGYTYTPAEAPDDPGFAPAAHLDVWLRNDLSGARLLWVTLHEIGHALGLGHPFDDNQVSRIGALNNLLYTMMSYTNSFPGTTDSRLYPQTLMPLDLAALWAIYGQTSYREGDTLYQWADDSKLFLTLWDTGGIDTLDLSNFSGNNVIRLGEDPGNADLREVGYYSYLLKTGQTLTGLPTSPTEAAKIDGVIAIPWGRVLIENAIGGPGNDTLSGNQAANRLEGGAGNDLFEVLGNGDTALGGPGDDIFIWDSRTLDFALFDGGDDQDSLILTAQDIRFDLEDLTDGQVQNIEIIQMGGDDQELVLTTDALDKLGVTGLEIRLAFRPDPTMGGTADQNTLGQNPGSPPSVMPPPELPDNAQLTLAEAGWTQGEEMRGFVTWTKTVEGTTYSIRVQSDIDVRVQPPPLRQAALQLAQEEAPQAPDTPLERILELPSESLEPLFDPLIWDGGLI